MARAFVYGTLKRGGWNHRYLERAEFIGEATIRGSMFDCGAFPAVVVGGDGKIFGEVYEVDEPTLARLDQLEGVPHLYQRVEVTSSDCARAWTYTMNFTQTHGRSRIPSGRWERT